MTPALLALIIFGIIVLFFIWDKLPMATTALLGCAVMVVLGFAPFSTAFGQIASTTVIMLVSVLIIGSAFVETGLANIIGNVVMKLTRNNERLLILVTFLIAYGLSTFLTNVTVLAIFIPIVFAISAAQKNIKPMNIVIPITLASNAGGISTLIGSSQQMTAQGLLEEYGYTGFKVFDFMPMGLILALIFLLYSLTLGYTLGKKIWGDRSEAETGADIKLPESIRVKKSRIVSISIIFVCMIVLYIFQKIPFTQISVSPAVTAVMAALACIVTRCIDQKKALANINWNIVLRLAGCLGLAAVLNEAGSIEIVKEWFLGLAGENFSPVLFYIIAVIFAWVSSLFISNSTSISIAMLLVLSVAPTLGLNVYTFAMATIFASSIGCCCPLSGSTWGVAMAAGYKFKDFFKYGLLIDLISLIISAACAPLIFGGISA